jgi:hypothetical protein
MNLPLRIMEPIQEVHVFIRRVVYLEGQGDALVSGAKRLGVNAPK